MNTSAFVIACALQDDESERTITLLAMAAEEQRLLYNRIALLDRCSRALHEPIAETEQTQIRDRVGTIAERMAGPEDLTDLGKLRKRVNFILAATMNDMAQNRRSRELTLILADLFGPEEGERIALMFLARARRQGLLD